MYKRFFVPYLLFVAFLAACSGSKELAENDFIIEEEILDTIEINAHSPLDLYRASRTREHDLLHTKLEVSFDWDSLFLYGNAYLTLKPYFYATDSLTLDAKGFQIHKVALLDKLGKEKELTYSYDTLQLHIALDKEYSRKDTFRLFIKYTAMPERFESGGSVAITSDKGLYFINPDGADSTKPRQIWTQGETEASSRWFPTIDAPNERTTQEIYITVDTNFQTLSNGALMFQSLNGDGTRTDYWKQKLPHAPYLFMMAIGEYAIVEDEWEGIPTNYYVEPEYKAFAKNIYPNTPEMLGFFSEILDYKYPWDKFHQVIVRDYVSGAMENTGAVIYGEFIQLDGRELLDSDGEDIVAHELFHHWFGDLVTTESWSNLPLNESFATYGEYLWNEHKYGRYKADQHRQRDKMVYFQDARTKKKPLIRYHYEHRMDMFDGHSYQKGGLVLHMLRNYVGDEAFFQSLNRYLRDNEFQAVEIHQLRLAFEEVTGKDLNWFFNQWFLSPGHPELDIEFDYVDSTQTLSVLVEQTQDEEEVPRVFILPTELAIIAPSGEVTYKEIMLDQRKDTFIYSLPAEPAVVLFDPHDRQLWQGEQKFDEEQAILIYRGLDNYFYRSEALGELKGAKDTAAYSIIKDGLNHEFYDIRKSAISSIKNLAKAEPEYSRKKLEELAANDAKSSVRAAAIGALSKYFDKDVSADFFRRGMLDSSYVVNSTSLEALYEVDEQAGIEAAAALENSKNTSITSTLARIYADDASPKHHVFYKRAIRQSSGFGSYPLLISYNEYLGKQEPEVTEEAVPFLKEIASGDSFWFIRMAAINGLVSLKTQYDKEMEATQEALNQDEVENRALLDNKMAKLQSARDEVQEALVELKEEETNKNLLNILNRQVD
jgi:aminopeptidase N